MNVLIKPSRSLSGEITAPPSKANTHRALIAGLLSEGITELVNPLQCDDTDATATAIASLGAEVTYENQRWSICSKGTLNPPRHVIDCRESGVTLRFMIPIVSLTGQRVLLEANPSLIRRPLKPLQEALQQLHVRVAAKGNSIIVEGEPHGENVRIRGDVSSQFISGLLFAGSVMDNGLRLEVTTPLESRNYVTLTIRIMEQHGIKIVTNPEMTRMEILPGQKYRASRHLIHGDFSSAAFALAAAATTHSNILVHDLRQSQSEPDFALLEILARMGASTSLLEDDLIIEGGHLKAVRLDIRNSPDLGPILAVLGCYAEGETGITGANRLRYKESDRLATIASELNALGARITEDEDGLIIQGPSSLHGGVVQSHNDHRIAMALSVAALGASGGVIITDAGCVSKSYPNFFRDLRSLGVELNEQ